MNCLKMSSVRRATARRRLPLVLLYWGGMEKMKQIMYGVTDVALCEAI